MVLTDETRHAGTSTGPSLLALCTYLCVVLGAEGRVRGWGVGEMGQRLCSRDQCPRLSCPLISCGVDPRGRHSDFGCWEWEGGMALTPFAYQMPWRVLAEAALLSWPPLLLCPHGPPTVLLNSTDTLPSPRPFGPWVVTSLHFILPGCCPEPCLHLPNNPSIKCQTFVICCWNLAWY